MSKTETALEVSRPGGISEVTWGKLEKIDPTTRQVALALLGGRIEFELDPEAIQRDIVTRILEAPSSDAALRMGVAIHARDVLGMPFVLTGSRFQESGFDAGPGAYALLEAIHDNSGEAMVITCGSLNVMAQVIKLALEGDLPKRVKLVESDKPTQQGFHPMWLAPA